MSVKYLGDGIILITTTTSKHMIDVRKYQCDLFLSDKSDMTSEEEALTSVIAIVSEGIIDEPCINPYVVLYGELLFSFQYDTNKEAENAFDAIMKARIDCMYNKNL